MTDLKHYRASQNELARTNDLLHLLPKKRRSVLDVGARDGHFSRLLTEHFAEVTALDLERPQFEFPRIVTIAGDVTNLPFDDGSFDCVFCAEVLEHIPNVQKACAEITRITRHEIIIGVPYKQDIRVGRTTCRHCNKTNPPWGHVNTFDEDRLAALFSGLPIISKSFVGTTTEATNPISVFLMDIARNPWGTYNQEEHCIHCGCSLTPPKAGGYGKRSCSALAIRINRLQALWTKPHGNWIHLVFSK